MVLYITHNISHILCNLIECSGAISRLWSKSLNGLLHEDLRKQIRSLTFSSQFARHIHQELSSKIETKMKQSKKPKDMLSH